MAKEQVWTLFDGSPDSFGLGFLDDFDGVYTSAIWTARRYGVNSKKYGLFYQVSIKPDDSDEELTYHLRAGFLGNFVPSKDGKTPAGATLEEYKELSQGKASIEDGTEDDFSGPYLIAPGTGQKVLPPSDYHQHMFCLRELGFDKVDPRADVVVGTHAHFNRLSVDERIIDRNGKKIQINQKMQVKEGQEAPTQEWKIICPTLLLDPVKVTKPATTKSTTTTTTSKQTESAASEGSDVDMMLEMDISGVLQIAGEPLPRNKVVEAMRPIFSEYENEEAKRNALVRMSNVKWMTDPARPWKHEGGKILRRKLIAELITN